MIVGVLVGMLMLMAMAMASGDAGGAMRAAGTEYAARANASGASGAHDQHDGHGHNRKEGKLAVALSVLGIIVVVSLIVFLGSLSVRRRMNDVARETDREVRGPPEGKRGLFS